MHRGCCAYAYGKLERITFFFQRRRIGSFAIKAALERANVGPHNVDEVYMGNVLQAGLGQNPARQASTLAGIPITCPATTVNKVCASGMKAVALAANSIRLGEGHVIVAGGFESMSRSPHCIPSMRRGVKYGAAEIIDIMQHDGLTNPIGNMKGQLMGNCGDLCSRQYNIGREEQDKIASASYVRCHEARTQGKFKGEIIEFQCLIHVVLQKLLPMTKKV